jgi:hypothetical protein
MIPDIFSLKKNLLLIVLLLMVSALMSYGQSIEVKVEDASCNGKEDGKIDIITTGNYTYLWNDNSTKNHLYEIPKGKYWVVITDPAGCVLKKDIEVGVKEDKPKVKIEGGGEQAYCPEDGKEAAQLTASVTDCEECKYIWSTKSNAKEIKVESDGEYNLTVIDFEQCSAKDSVKVEYKSNDCDEDDDEADIPAPNSSDPNDILGPEGVGARKWVSISDELLYKIRFENDPKLATAPAQKVIIRSPLSPNLDIYSLRLGSFGFGDFVFEAPQNTTFYSTRLDVSDSLKVLVDLVAGIDVVNKEAFWIFESVDPETNLPPAGDLGFLLINDTITHRGEGFVSFGIKAASGSLTGDTIKALADIIFDNNGSILTPEIFNTIDAFPPVSKHRTMPSDKDSVFIYAVNAVDDFGINGSGSHTYDLYLSEENGNGYNLYAQNIPIDSLLHIKAAPNKELCAYTISRDSVGNAEYKSVLDICFNTEAKPFLQMNTIATEYCQGETLEVSWTYNKTDTVNIFISSDSGTTYKILSANIPARHRSFSWRIPVTDTVLSSNYFIKLVAQHTDTIFDVSKKPFEIFRHTPVKIAASNGLEFCQGVSTVLSFSGQYDAYEWSNGLKENQVIADTSGWYKIVAANNNSCSSSDSVQVLVHATPSKPQVTSSDSTLLCKDATKLLSAPIHFSEFLWSTGEVASTIEVKEIGKYAVTVKDAYGCAALSDTISITLAEDSICTVSALLKNTNSGSFSLEAFPNPMKDLTHIRFKLPVSTFASLSLYNLQGIKVSEIFNGEIVGNMEHIVKLKSDGLIAGVYFCKLVTRSGEEESIKIIIN